MVMTYIRRFRDDFEMISENILCRIIAIILSCVIMYIIIINQTTN